MVVYTKLYIWRVISNNYYRKKFILKRLSRHFYVYILNKTINEIWNKQISHDKNIAIPSPKVNNLTISQNCMLIN